MSALVSTLKKAWPRRGLLRGVADWFRLIRWQNLAIMAATQWLVWAFLLKPVFSKHGVLMATDELFLSQIIIATVLAAASGYIVNDFFDQKTDAINRPDRRVVGASIGPISTWLFYKISVGATVFFALALQKQASPFVGSFNLWIYPLVAVGLFIYSRWLKCSPVLGNLAIAALCAAVPLVVFFQEKRPMQVLAMHSPQSAAVVEKTIWAYALFAFAATLLREIVKDLEDKPGDAACRCWTLPVVAGSMAAKALALVTAAFLFGFSVWWALDFSENDRTKPAFWASLALLVAPSGLIFGHLWQANDEKGYGLNSVLIKILMAGGLALLAFFEA